jgi:TolB-like protein/lipopolysaccharide biosynthesis regulator YciM
MSIEGATMWSQEIVAAIRNCKVLILAISGNSADSENVVKELALASEDRKRILPVYLESAKIPQSMAYQLAGIQRVEFFEGDEDAGQQSVIRALAKLGVKVNEEASKAAAGAPKRTSHGLSHSTTGQQSERVGSIWVKIAAAVGGATMFAAGLYFLGGSKSETTVTFGQAVTNAVEQATPLPQVVNLDTNRVVVLPFKTIGTTGETADLGYGLVSTLTSKLQPLHNLVIIAKESARKFKDSERSPREIGQALSVGTIVTGEIQTGGADIQVNIQLINANTEALGWGSTFTKPKDEFLNLQSEIATKLASELKGGLDAAEAKQLSQKATESAEAQAEYQSGRREWNKRSKEGFENAIKHFDKAIELDPSYADPYTGLADTYSLLDFYNHASKDEVIPIAKKNAEMAMQKNPKLSKAYVSMAGLLHNEYKWIDAEKNYKRAIELNPNYATGMHWYAFLLRNMGKFNEALVKLTRAEQSDPSSMIIKCDLAYIHYGLGNKKQALIYADKALSIEPDFRRVLRLKYVNLLSEETSKGIEKFNILLNTNENMIEDRLALFDLYIKDQSKLAALEQFSQIVGDMKTSRENCASIAMMYFKLDNIEYANAWLHQAIKNRETGERFWDLSIGGEFQEWHANERFKQLMQLINHPAYQD